MKNTVLLSLLIVLMLSFGCSSNDDDNESIETQTFLEKYDGVVWLEDRTDSLDDYAYLIQFLQSSKSLVDNEMPNGIDGSSYCDTETLTYITENTEDTFVQSFGTMTRSYTVTNLGASLKYKFVDTDPSDPSEEVYYYTRSNLGMNCN
jgi:hypothetical protein